MAKVITEGFDDIMQLCENQNLSFHQETDTHSNFPFKHLIRPDIRKTSAWRGYYRGKTQMTLSSIPLSSNSHFEISKYLKVTKKHHQHSSGDADGREMEVIVDLSEDNERSWVNSEGESELVMWLDWMRESDQPNLLFYGLGSKKNLLDKLQELIIAE